MRMTSVPDTKVVDEIPSSMQKLARLVARGFYGVEHSVLIDLLIRNVCMREDDLRDLLRFDAKQLRTVLISLKQSKIIKERQLTEQRPDGRPLRQNYYFINYRALLNVMKYKVDHMRRKLESEEKTSTHRSTFKCSKCKKPYSDLDINLLWNGDEMQCTFCRGVVEEDLSALPNQNARSSLARFNEQMWPYFQLMQELEGVTLAPHLLEPMPANLSKGRAELNGVLTTSGASTATSASLAHKKAEFEIYRSGFTVNIEGTEGAGGSDSSSIVGGSTNVKEVPVWMQTSTLSPPHTTTADVGDDQKQSTTMDVVVKMESVSSGFSPKHQDIVNTLLVHETKIAPTTTTTMTNIENEVKTETVDDDDKNEEDVRDDEDDEFEEVDDADDDREMTVTVQGKSYLLGDINENPDLLSQMTDAEKEQYIKLSQIAFQNMYGD